MWTNHFSKSTAPLLHQLERTVYCILASRPHWHCCWGISCISFPSQTKSQHFAWRSINIYQFRILTTETSEFIETYATKNGYTHLSSYVKISISISFKGYYINIKYIKSISSLCLVYISIETKKQWSQDPTKKGTVDARGPWWRFLSFQRTRVSFGLFSRVRSYCSSRWISREPPWFPTVFEWKSSISEAETSCFMRIIYIFPYIYSK